MKDLTVKKKILFSLVLAFISILIVGVVFETTIRLIGEYDAHGGFIFGRRMIKPYQLPATDLQDKIDRYLANDSKSMLYDPVLGWSPAPQGVSEDGLFHYNSVGIRSAPTEYTLVPDFGVLRIALFGDSFTAGDEVLFENSWGHQLETLMREAGVKTEVINFGVNGYGMDQAFLRWKELGRRYSPHVVLFGLMMWDVQRNLNLFRRFVHFRTKGIFTKPRFLLESDSLRLINSPTVPPALVPQLIRNFGDWDLAEYEYFYNPDDYQEHLWLKSRLIATTMEAVERLTRRHEFFRVGTEPTELALKITSEFEEEVEASGADFLVVYLPAKRDGLRPQLKGRRLRYADFLQEVKNHHETIDPSRALLDEARKSSLDELFGGRVDPETKTRRGGHYSPLGNRVVARAVADYLLARTAGE